MQKDRRIAYGAIGTRIHFCHSPMRKSQCEAKLHARKAMQSGPKIMCCILTCAALTLRAVERWGRAEKCKKNGWRGIEKKGGGESKEEATKKGGNDLARCNTIFNCVYRWLLLHCSFQAPKSNWIGRQRQRNGERDSCSVGKRDGEMARERDGARRPTALA